MSVRVMTKIWDAVFPTSSMKLVALKLADCANDEGENIYPSVRRVEQETGLSASAVRDCIADMEASGLLSVIVSDFGNRRGRSTVVRAFEMDRLNALSAGVLEWVQVDIPVCDPKSREQKVDPKTGETKTRKAWRLIEKAPSAESDPSNVRRGTPPISGGVPLQPPDPSPPATGGVPLQPPDPLIEEPSIEPSLNHHTHTSGEERVCVGGTSTDEKNKSPSAPEWHPLIVELLAEGKHLHVVEEFLAPLVGALQWGGEDPRFLIRAIRDELANFDRKVLAKAAADIRGKRTKWPSAAIARQACLAAQREHALYRIEPGTLAWSAWTDHLRRTGYGNSIKFFESQGYMLQRSEFPPVNLIRRGNAK